MNDNQPNFGYVPPNQQQPPYPPMPYQNQPYPYQQQQQQPYPYHQQQPIMMQPMQQPNYYQQPAVIVQQPTSQPVNVTVIQQGPVGKDPQVVTCPNCKETVTSNVTHHANSNTHMTACFLCFLGWCCCCCFVPYCMDKCKSQRHSCPRCGAYLGENNESSSQICCFAGIAAICCCMNDGGCCGDCEGCGDCGDCEGCGDCAGDCFD